MKYKHLKDLLIEIQKENKSGKSKLLNEIKEYRNSNEYKISLEQLAEEILLESDPGYGKRREKEIQNKLYLGYKGGGAWNKQQYESLGDYEERVTKADTRLQSLIGRMKGEIVDSWKELNQIPTINSLDDNTKKEVLKVLISKLNIIAGEMLETLSVYPFEWDFEEDNLDRAISRIV
jgi:hypothetical protein